MEAFYFICFGIGVGYTIIGFLLGEVLGLLDLHLDFGGDAHVDMGGHDAGGHDFGGHDVGGHDLSGHDIGGHDMGGHSLGSGPHETGSLSAPNGAGAYGGSLSPLKPCIIAAFLTVFGGSGLIMGDQFGLLTALLFSALFGMAIAAAFYRFIITPMYKAQNTSAVEMQSLIGQSATVSEAIPQGGYGKITYRVNSSIYSAPAKSVDGEPVAKHGDVQIIHIEKNTYFVRRK